MPKKQGKTQNRETKKGKCQMWKTPAKNQQKTGVTGVVGLKFIYEYQKIWPVVIITGFQINERPRVITTAQVRS